MSLPVRWVPAITFRFARGLGWALLAGLTLMVLPLPGQVLPGNLDPTFLTQAPDDIVRTIVVMPDETILVGGHFRQIGDVERGGVARLTRDGELDPGFNPGSGTDGRVHALSRQPDGRILIAGAFTSFDSVPRVGVARLEPDGTLDLSFDPAAGADQQIWTIVVADDGGILVGGDFWTFNGVLRPGLARLTSSGELDPAFAPLISGPVRAIVLQGDGRILVGGSFSSINGIERIRLARLEADGTLDTSFDPGNGADNWVNTLALQPDGKVLVGGNFDNLRGLRREGLGRLNQDGTLDESFVFPIPAGLSQRSVTSIALQPDGKLLVVGANIYFTRPSEGLLARLTANGSMDPIFESDLPPDNWLESVALQGEERALIGGAFTQVTGVAASYLAGVGLATPPPFAPRFTLEPTNSAVIEGSDVRLVSRATGLPLPSYQWQRNEVNIPGATERDLFLPNIRASASGSYRVLASNPLGATPSSSATVAVSPAPTHLGAADLDFYPGLGADDDVELLAIQTDGRILIAGQFGLVDGAPSGIVARLLPDGARDTTFLPPLLGSARALVPLPAGGVLVGGNLFGQGGSVPYGGVVKLTGDGRVDSTFRANVPTAGALALQADGRILVGGAVPLPNGLMVWGVGRLEASGTSDASFQVAMIPEGAINVLTVQPDGRILVAGNFTSIRGEVRNRVARLNSDGTLDLSFDPGSGASGPVLDLALQTDGRIVVAGGFHSVNGFPRAGVARLLADGSLDLSLDPGEGTDGVVRAVDVQSDGRIFIAGDFTSVDGVTRMYLARLHPDGGLDPTLNPGAGPNGEVRALTITGERELFIGGSFTTVDGVPRSRVARLLGGNAPAQAPGIDQQPATQVAVAGEDVRFSVLARGVPVPAYAWEFNGSLLPEAEQWILTLRNVRDTHAGVYRAIVSNPLGSLPSDFAQLTVLPAPRQPGSADIDFYTGLGPNDRVNVVRTVADGKILIAGRFTQVDGTPRHRIARLNRDGSHDLTFAPGAGADGEVFALDLQDDGRILIGGAFTEFGDVRRVRVARLLANGELDPSFDPGLGPDLPVRAVLSVTGQQVLIAGDFLRVQGIDRSGVVRLDAGGTIDLTFAGRGGFIGGSIYALAQDSDDRILVAGNFQILNGTLRNRLGRLSPEGALDLAFQPFPSLSGELYALAVQPDGKILAGGNVQQNGLAVRSSVYRLESSGVLDATFSLGVTGLVQTLVLQADGRILAGGSQLIAASPRQGAVLRLENNGTVDASFDPEASLTDGTSFVDEYGMLMDQTSARSLALEGDGRILVGGDFTRVNGIGRRFIARLHDRTPSSAVQIRLTLRPEDQRVQLDWEIGVLQQAPSLDGPWTALPDVTSPYLLVPADTQRFFRLKFN